MLRSHRLSAAVVATIVLAHAPGAARAQSDAAPPALAPVRTVEACQNRQSGLWGLCRADGSNAPPVLAQEFDFIGRGGPLFPARRTAGQPMGYIDASGQWRIPPVYRTAGPFSEGLAVVGDGERSAAIDATGKRVVDWFRGLLYPYAQGLACYVPDGSIELNAMGRLRQKWFGKPGEDPYPAAWWRIEGRAGFLDTRGQVAIAPRFEPKLNFLLAGCGFGTAGYAAMRQDGKEGLIDRRGNWVVQPEYDYLGIVFSGYRNAVALIADRTIERGLFLDTVERLDGFMAPDGHIRWRDTGPPRESVVAGGLVRAFFNQLLFPRWQQDLTNEDVSSRMLVAWVGCILAGLLVLGALLRRSTSAGGIALALGATLVTVPAVFLAGLLSVLAVPVLLVLAVAAYAIARTVRRRRGAVSGA